MLIDRDQRLTDAPDIETTAPAEIRSTLAVQGGRPGESEETPESTPERPEPKQSDEDEEDKLDEELDESFPASDPPSSTQP